MGPRSLSGSAESSREPPPPLHTDRRLWPSPNRRSPLMAAGSPSSRICRAARDCRPRRSAELSEEAEEQGNQRPRAEEPGRAHAGRPSPHLAAARQRRLPRARRRRRPRKEGAAAPSLAATAREGGHRAAARSHGRKGGRRLDLWGEREKERMEVGLGLRVFLYILRRVIAFFGGGPYKHLPLKIDL